MAGMEENVKMYSYGNNVTFNYSLTEENGDAEFDFAGVMGCNAHFGFADNTTSEYPVQVEVSADGASYADPFLAGAGKSVALDGMNIAAIRVTRSEGDSAGQIVIW